MVNILIQSISPDSILLIIIYNYFILIFIYMSTVIRGSILSVEIYNSIWNKIAEYRSAPQYQLIIVTHRDELDS